LHVAPLSLYAAGFLPALFAPSYTSTLSPLRTTHDFLGLLSTCSDLPFFAFWTSSQPSLSASSVRDAWPTCRRERATVSLYSAFFLALRSTSCSLAPARRAPSTDRTMSPTRISPSRAAVPPGVIAITVFFSSEKATPVDFSV
jgi:hypothetical protein